MFILRVENVLIPENSAEPEMANMAFSDVSQLLMRNNSPAIKLREMRQRYIFGDYGRLEVDSGRIENAGRRDLANVGYKKAELPSGNSSHGFPRICKIDTHGGRAILVSFNRFQIYPRNFGEEYPWALGFNNGLCVQQGGICRSFIGSRLASQNSESFYGGTRRYSTDYDQGDGPQSDKNIRDSGPPIRFGVAVTIAISCYFGGGGLVFCVLLTLRGWKLVVGIAVSVSVAVFGCGVLIWWGWLSDRCNGGNANCVEDRDGSDSPFHGNTVTRKLLTERYYCNTLSAVGRVTMSNVLSIDRQVALVGALAERSSIRAMERMTGVRRDTVMRLGAVRAAVIQERRELAQD